MAHSKRDNFSAAVCKAVSARAGHRCSNITCRRLTSRPDPVNPDRAINVGVASHITAASPGGPRYDPSIDSEERASFGNAIWLCEICAKVVDAAPDAFTKDGLLAWKSYAESAAARDSVAIADQIGPLVVEIGDACDLIREFCDEWASREPPEDFNIPFAERTEAYRNHSQNRVSAYYKKVSPRVIFAIEKAEAILGPDHPNVGLVRHWQRAAHTNYITMQFLATELERLKAALLLR